jgi:hypothetical protein
MNQYVFDTSGLCVLRNYFPSRFLTLWAHIDTLVKDGRLLSVREVLNELELFNDAPFIQEWAGAKKSIFYIPSAEETIFVAEIFKVQHFKSLISKKNLLTGRPVADPFIIAAGKIKKACVVTQEIKKEHAAKIPNICEHFHIKCTNVEGFMEMENWSF